MKVKSKRFIRIVSRLGAHTGGTKWYRVTMVSLITATDKQEFLINSWGAHGKNGFSKFEENIGANEYEDSRRNKEKSKAGGKYVFGPESIDSIGIGESDSLVEVNMKRLGLSTMSETQMLMRKMRAFLEPIAGEIVGLEPEEVLVDHDLILQKVASHDYGSQWGAF